MCTGAGGGGSIVDADDVPPEPNCCCPLPHPLLRLPLRWYRSHHRRHRHSAVFADDTDRRRVRVEGFR